VSVRGGVAGERGLDRLWVVRLGGGRRGWPAEHPGGWGSRAHGGGSSRLPDSIS